MRRLYQYILSIICLILFIFIFRNNNADCMDFKEVKTPYVVILCSPSLEGLSKKSVEIYLSVKKSLEKDMGWQIRFVPVMVFVKDGKRFNEMAKNPYFTAFAIPGKKVMVFNWSKMRDNPVSFESTMKHELCHLFIHSYITKTKIPRWLDEGIAQWVSSGISELLNYGTGDNFKTAIIKDNIPELKDIAWFFPDDKAGLDTAYGASRSFINFIADKYGKKKLLQILDYMHKGEDIDSAVKMSLSLSLLNIEQIWRKNLKGYGALWIWFSIHLYEILFFLTALATIFGALRLARKKRDYKDEEDDDFF